MRVTRKHDVQFQIERLEKKRSELKQQLEELGGQRFLNASEDVQLHALKKEKLATKDELDGLRKRSSS